MFLFSFKTLNFKKIQTDFNEKKNYHKTKSPIDSFEFNKAYIIIF